MPHQLIEEATGWFHQTWPELAEIPYLWLTGGQIWRRYYDKPLEEAKDVDLFTPSKRSLARAIGVLLELSNKGPGAGGTSSWTANDGALGGSLYNTNRGRVDLWFDTRPTVTLMRYSELKADCRMALCIKTGQFLMMPKIVGLPKDGNRIVCNPDGTGLGWSLGKPPNV